MPPKSCKCIHPITHRPHSENHPHAGPQCLAAQLRGRWRRQPRRQIHVAQPLCDRHRDVGARSQLAAERRTLSIRFGSQCGDAIAVVIVVVGQQLERRHCGGRRSRHGDDSGRDTQLPAVERLQLRSQQFVG